MNTRVSFAPLVANEDEDEDEDVLALADAVAPHASIVFISHHRDEILPCVTHVLDLAQNEAPTFVGPMRAWTPP